MRLLHDEKLFKLYECDGVKDLAICISQGRRDCAQVQFSYAERGFWYVSHTWSPDQ